jgi:Ca2+-binding EF-hand superfamily protein
MSPQDLANLQAWFSSVDKDRSGSITANELGTLNFGGKPLGLATAKKLIKVFDKNYSGSIDFAEYASLHGFLLKMQGAFFAADQDRSGFLDYREIYNALVQAGFQLQMPTVQAICQKYDTSKKGLSWDQFLQACAHLATARSIFEWNDPQRTGKVTLSYDQLAHVTVHMLDS